MHILKSFILLLILTTLALTLTLHSHKTTLPGAQMRKTDCGPVNEGAVWIFGDLFCANQNWNDPNQQCWCQNI